MKKVFKASLMAAAVVFALNANAADVAIAPVITVTDEAVTTNVAITAAPALITIFNRQELSAGDKISLSFPRDTVLPVAGRIFIRKGAATATFSDPLVVPQGTTGGPKITYEILTGNPLVNNSKIEVAIDYTDATTPGAAGNTYVPKSGAVVYEARDGFTDAVKDTTGTGTGTANQATLINTVAQEAVSLTTQFDGFIQRLNRQLFTAGKGSQVAVVNIRENNATVKALPVAGVSNTVVLKGNGDITGLASVTITDAAANSNTVLAADFTASNPAAPTVLDTATFDVSGLDVDADGENWTISVVPSAAAGKTIPVTSFTVTRKITYNQVAAAPAVDLVKTTDFAAGKFQLDASVVNIPYLPIGYTQFSPVVEVSNLGATPASITIEAVGKTGAKYGPTTLTKMAAANAVTSVFESDIFAAFNLAKGSNEKLSISFVIDANAADITLVPYYREGESRVGIISDQYKK